MRPPIGAARIPGIDPENNDGPGYALRRQDQDIARLKEACAAAIPRGDDETADRLRRQLNRLLNISEVASQVTTLEAGGGLPR